MIVTFDKEYLMPHKAGVSDNMIANNLTSFIPTHPGDVIKDEIEYRGITQRQLSETTGIAYSVINEVLNGKRPVTIEYALLIGKALDLDAGTFIRMQSEYDMQMAQRNTSFTARLAKIRKIASVL
jgi:addiction module HigA family antidote